MSENSFYKLSGAGNDFVLFDLKENKNLLLDGDLVQKLCDRRNGIGSDGIIMIDDSPDSDFIMTYYNADGSRGSLCGNGARCAIKFAQFSGRLLNSETTFTCEEVRYSGKTLDNGNIKFYLQQPTGKIDDIYLEAGGYEMKAWYINTGSPHAVINVNDIKSDRLLSGGSINLQELPVVPLGREIRHSEQFAPDGVNVNFIQMNEDRVFIRTYERGVENETLACGTGSVASAIFINEVYNVPAPVTLITHGKDELVVEFTRNGQTVENLSLTGPAKIIFKGKISISNL
jgi:diaminopimelate epimerase